MKDHSQWGESAIIKTFFGEFVGAFLDIGAYDGIIGSNTRALAESGWKGVCIEASPENFLRLLANCKSLPNVECVNAAVVPAANAGLQKFFALPGQCGTLLEKDAPHYWVATIDAHGIFERFGTCDFLSIDAEGMDYEILESAVCSVEPKLICFEDDQPMTRNPDYKKKLLSMLAGFGYTRIVGTTSTDDRSANTLVARQ